MQRKILVFGANGQVGREIMRQAGDAAIGFDRASVDISDAAAVRQAVAGASPFGDRQRRGLYRRRPGRDRQ